MRPTIEPHSRKRRSRDELRALAESGATLLEQGSAEQLIDWVAGNFATESVAVACSMADAVLPHLVSRRIPGVDVLFLETGYHFAETEATRAEVARALNIRLINVLPKQTVVEQDAQYGVELFARNPTLCCALRKVEPLHECLAGYEVWFSGLRRDEGPTRAGTALIGWDERNGLVKVNPIASWTFDELLEYANSNAVPVNPLIASGYPSIGCAPCTRAVAGGGGGDQRAGRWAGLAKTECGLHA